MPPPLPRAPDDARAAPRPAPPAARPGSGRAPPGAAAGASDRLDLPAFLPYQLAAAAARVSRAFAARYRREFGLSIPEWRILAHLAESGPVGMREIQARADLEKSRVSRAAARLEAAGYIAKAGNAADRRSVDLALTARGEALVARLVPVARAFQEELLARLGAEAEPFRRALARLAADPPGSPEAGRAETGRP